MTISQVLARAAKLVEKGFCRNDYALDRAGYPIKATSRHAVRFCAVGAIANQGTVLPGLFDFLCAFVGDADLTGWSDDRTGPEVACWLSSAAEYAKVLGR